MADLKELYFSTLKDLYDVEHRMIDSIPRMVKQVTSDELKTALESHLTETQMQVQRLESIFSRHDKEAERETCKAIKGLIAEAEEEMKEWKGEDHVKDAAIIASAQKIEHYEIAGYGTAKCYAMMLGLDEDVKILQETLDEEKFADSKLTEVAIGEVNHDAMAGNHERKVGINPSPRNTIAP